ncbi:MAG TPA: hypothetical protein VGQ95_12145 [Chthoniobacterales bacterium]|nr:hypothetical protein [Chthoniobacterales bacterium]
MIGGIVLLKAGVIKLEQVAPGPGSSDGISAEILKFIKIQTRYPALGLFVIGLVFVVTAALISKPTDTAAVTLKGLIDAPNPAAFKVEVNPTMWAKLSPDNDGTVDALFHPDVQKIAIHFFAPPGMDRPTDQRTLDLRKDRILDFKRIKFSKVLEEPSPGPSVPPPANIQNQAAVNVQAKSLPATIISLPKDVKIEPLESKKAF